MSEFIIYQTDERMFLLKELLKGVTPSRRTHVFAPNILIGAKLIEEIKPSETVIGGRADIEAEAIFNSLDVRYFNMMSDEKFQSENAKLTAEGTVGVILAHSLISIAQSDILVIGFGRTGAAVVRSLNAFGARSITVATNSSIRPAMAFADNVVPISPFDFSIYDVVINTVPQPIISDKEVLTFKPSAVYIDLASKPALSLCFAKYIGIDAEIYPAVPAKTAPQSAAMAMKDYIMRVLK